MLQIGDHLADLELAVSEVVPGNSFCALLTLRQALGCWPVRNRHLPSCLARRRAVRSETAIAPKVAEHDLARPN